MKQSTVKNKEKSVAIAHMIDLMAGFLLAAQLVMLVWHLVDTVLDVVVQLHQGEGHWAVGPRPPRHRRGERLRNHQASYNLYHTCVCQMIYE